MNIFALTSTQFGDELGRHYPKAARHAASIYREVFKQGGFSVTSSPDLASSQLLSSQLSRDVTITTPCVTAVRGDGVVKFATQLADGNTIESVIIPEKSRTTLCLSSQAGCRLGCTFCATGANGFKRNLSTEEIVGQVFSARFTLASRVDNIVFMGMGEPFDNFDNVIQAIRVVSDQRGFDISHSHITVSSAGHVEGIRRLAGLDMPRLRLAVSLNAADQETRDALMPINKRFPLEELHESLRAFPMRKRDVFFIEYVLISGVNDSREMAAKLARYLHGLPVRVNIIPYNQTPLLPHVAPSSEQVEKFRSWLVGEKLFVRIRQPHGTGIHAACGQLGAWLQGADPGASPTVPSSPTEGKPDHSPLR